MAAGSIVIDLLMKTGSFITDTDRAAKRLKAFRKEAVDAARGIATNFAVIGTAVAGTFVAFENLVTSVADLQDLADKIGDTAVNVAGLQRAADISETSLDNVAAASVRLTASLSKTDDESDAVAKALAAINIPLEEFKRLNPTTQIERVAQEMAKFEDGAGKTAIAVALFGKAGADLIPFLKDLAEVGAKNSQLTQQQIDDADKHAKSLAHLKSEFQDMARVVAVTVLPTLTEYAGKIKELFGGPKTDFTLKNEIFGIRGELAELQRRKAEGFGLFEFLGFGSEEQLDAQIKQVEGKLQTALKNYYRLTEGAGAGRGMVNPALPLNFSGAPDKPDSKATASEAERYLETLQNQLDRVKELTVTEQVLADIRRKSIAGLTPQLEQQLLAVAAEIDARKRLESQLQAEAEQLKDLKAEQDELERQGRAVFEATRTPLEKLNTELAHLNDLLNKGAVDWDTYVRAVAKAQDEFTATASSGEKALNEMGEFAKQAARNIQSTLGDTLFDAMQGNFDNIGDRFKAVLDRMVADALAGRLAEKMFGNYDKTGQVGGWAGGLADWLFGSSAPQGGTTGDFARMDRGGGSSGGASPWWEAAASWIGNFFGGSRAVGGDVMPGAGYLVGENGSEYFRPRTAGTIFPASAVSAMAKGQTVNYSPTFVLQAPADRRTQNQIAAQAMIGAQRALVRNG